MGDVAAPRGLTGFFGGFLEPDLDDERMGIGLKQVHADAIYCVIESKLHLLPFDLALADSIQAMPVSKRSLSVSRSVSRRGSERYRRILFEVF